MPTPSEIHLSRRERQIMDIVYARGEVSVSDVHQAMGGRPSYSAVRALMRILEQKGHIKHREVGIKYIFLPTRSIESVSRSAMKRLLKTFFDGSAARTAAAILEISETKPSPQELDHLSQLIEKARKEGR